MGRKLTAKAILYARIANLEKKLKEVEAERDFYKMEVEVYARH